MSSCSKPFSESKIDLLNHFIILSPRKAGFSLKRAHGTGVAFVPSRRSVVMAIGIYSALSGTVNKEEELEAVAHNIANASANGFKEHKISFGSVLSKYQSDINPSATPFAEITERSIDFSPGTLVQTSNDLDMAIDGEGFFEVQKGSESLYTRNGTFAIDSSGNLVTASGHLVMGTSGAIQIGNGGNVQISSSGNIQVDGEDRGSLKVVRFGDTSQLSPVGSSMFKAAAGASPSLNPQAQVLQGKLESSNVNVMRNLITLIEVSREYQTYQKVISAQNKLDQEGTPSIGKVA